MLTAVSGCHRALHAQHLTRSMSALAGALPVCRLGEWRRQPSRDGMKPHTLNIMQLQAHLDSARGAAGDVETDLTKLKAPPNHTVDLPIPKSLSSVPLFVFWSMRRYALLDRRRRCSLKGQSLAHGGGSRQHRAPALRNCRLTDVISCVASRSASAVVTGMVWQRHSAVHAYGIILIGMVGRRGLGTAAA